MRPTIEETKHCLKVMAGYEVCEECNLYGTTGTDHCENDCIKRALGIVETYQKISKIVEDWESNAAHPKEYAWYDVVRLVKSNADLEV